MHGKVLNSLCVEVDHHKVDAVGQVVVLVGEGPELERKEQEGTHEDGGKERHYSLFLKKKIQSRGAENWLDGEFRHR